MGKTRKVASTGCWFLWTEKLEREQCGWDLVPHWMGSKTENLPADREWENATERQDID